MDRAADYLQTSNNFTNECRGCWQNSGLSQFSVVLSAFID